MLGGRIEDLADRDLFMIDTNQSTAAPPKEQDAEDEEAELTEELFGQLESKFQEGEGAEGAEEEELFVIDRGEKRPVWCDEEEGEREVDLGDRNITKKLKIGDESKTLTGRQLEERLRNQYTKIHATPNWATKPKQQSTLLASTGSLTQNSKTLPTKKLAVSRCKNLNFRKTANCVIKSLEFHPSATVGFVAGYSKSLDLFEVDGENNRHLHRQHFPNFPIDCARFTRAGGEEVILGSKRPHFYTFDLNKCTGTKMAGVRNKPSLHYKNFSLSSQYIGFQGQDGMFALFSAIDKQIVKCVSHRTRINCSVFVDEHHFVTGGQGGFLTYWDTRTWKPISDFQDEGALHCTAVGLSDRHLAVGSDSGVVNIYNRDDLLRSCSAKPLRAVMNLTTSVGNVTFNSTGELLAVSSKELKQSLRLVNLHSLHCVPNWPTGKTPLNYVNSVNFSPNSGYIGVGSSKGQALLYRLTHYPSF